MPSTWVCATIVLTLLPDPKIKPDQASTYFLFDFGYFQTWDHPLILERNMCTHVTASKGSGGGSADGSISALQIVVSLWDSRAFIATPLS